MDASDLAVISVVSVLAFGFMAMGIGFFGIWVGMRSEMREMKAELTTEIRVVGVRVSDVELEQARMRGVMSVIQPQAHAHEYTGGRPNPTADTQSPPPTAND